MSKGSKVEPEVIKDAELTHIHTWRQHKLLIWPTSQAPWNSFSSLSENCSLTTNQLPTGNLNACRHQPQFCKTTYVTSLKCLCSLYKPLPFLLPLEHI